jgi:hypothetical protein
LKKNLREFTHINEPCRIHQKKTGIARPLPACTPINPYVFEFLPLMLYRSVPVEKPINLIWLKS